MTAEDWRQEVIWRMTGECMVPEHTLQTPDMGRPAPMMGHEGGVENLRAHAMMYADVVRSRLYTGARVLDVGSGCGMASRAFFIRTGVPVVAIDRGDSHWLADALYPCPGVIRVVADIQDELDPVVLEHSPYDVVVMTDVYEHVAEADSLQACANIDRVTTDDAIIALSTPICLDGGDPNPFHLRVFRSKDEAISEVQSRLSGNKRVVWGRTGEHSLPWGQATGDNRS